MGNRVKFGFLLSRDLDDVSVFEPLSFGYLKSYMQKYGKSNIEMCYLDDKKEIDDSFDVIGISSTSQDYGEAIEIAQRAKKINPNIITVVGGHHITNMPHSLHKDIDVGFIGESEQSFLEFMNCFSEVGKLNIDELKKIDGIVFHERRGGVHNTKPRELIRPLDNIPVPDRSYVKNPYLFSSRGCPYKCSFCASTQYWQKVRFFSPDYVVEEIKQIKEQFASIKHLAFYDDLLMANKKRFRQFVSLMKEHQLNEEFSFNLGMRADLVDDEMCKLLREMNVSNVGLGVESGSERIYSMLKNGLGSVEANQNAIDKLSDYGFLVGISLIVGVPSETEKDVHATYQFAIRNLIAKKNSKAIC